jgi:acyl-CoA thioesterase I
MWEETIVGAVMIRLAQFSRWGRLSRRRYGVVGALLLPLLAGTPKIAAADGAKPLRIVAFGDSLTAGYMLPQGDGFAAKLEAALRKQGRNVTVVDGGVSGDTTSGGLARLDWTLGDGTDAVILELGANEMLRGVDPTIAERNLGAMLDQLKAKRIRVLLAGMRTMPSMGRDYAAAFDPIYERLAKRYSVPLYPFFLEGVVGDPAQHLPDGLHPNARGVDTIVARILPSVDALLDAPKG